MPERTDLPAPVEGLKVREAELPGGCLDGFHSSADALEFDPQFHLFVMWLVLHQEHLQPGVSSALTFTADTAHRAFQPNHREDFYPSVGSLFAIMDKRS